MSCALMVLGFLGVPAFGFTPDADCDGWSLTTPPVAASFFDVLVELKEGATVIRTASIGQIVAQGGSLDLGAAWDPPIDSGSYCLCISAVQYVGEFAQEPTDEELANHPADATVSHTLAPLCFDAVCGEPSGVDARTPGYWKNHPEAWPVTELALGDGGHVYSQECLLAVLGLSTVGDIRVPLIHHLIAAKLNLLAGTDASYVTGVPSAGDTIGDTIAAADAYLLPSLPASATCPTPFFAGAAPKGSVKSQGESLKTALDLYNNKDD
ncbi:MAG: hypothetical protein L0Z55_13220 [Planctomycetes bacterium]|nr:hypothetical protein [Planctomycetota bacterium]